MSADADRTQGREETPSRRRQMVSLGALTLVTVAIGSVVVVSAGGADEEDSSASQATATAVIERKDLVETDEVDGTLGYADARTVVNRLSGTVTWAAAEGSKVKTNHRLFEVDGQPVYLLDGTYPAFRELGPGDEGEDVAQLERNLRALGLDDDKELDIDREWDDATTQAVQRWQRRKGMDDDGTIELGRIVFAPGTRRIGEHLIEVGSSGSGGGQASGQSTGTGQPAATSLNHAQTMFASTDIGQVGSGWSDIPSAIAAQEPTPEATPTPSPMPEATPTPTPTPTSAPSEDPSAQTPGDGQPCSCEDSSTPEAGGGDPPSDGKQMPSAVAPSTGGGAGLGSAAAGAASAAPAASGATGGVASTSSGAATTDAGVVSDILTTTSTKRIVTVDLETTKSRLAERGAQVSVELPDGEDVAGEIVDVGTVAVREQNSDGTEGDATIELTIVLRGSKGNAIDQAPVDVSLEQKRADDVLTIPVTALLSQSGGGFAVEVVEGGTKRLVPVETGLSTDGDVEIEGEGLEAGMQVTDARV